MNAKEFLAAFPEVCTNTHTGGGCTAWEVELAAGAYVLITDGEDARQPDLKAKRAMFGIDFDCSGSHHEPLMMTWNQAAPWLRGVLDADKVIRAAMFELPRAATLPAVAFFFDKAGRSYNPKTETETQGRMRGAEALAQAEMRARDEGYSFHWIEDTDADRSGVDHESPLWLCMLRDATGHGVVGSLGGINFGADGEPWGDDYRRVVEAEMALEYLK